MPAPLVTCVLPLLTEQVEKRRVNMIKVSAFRWVPDFARGLVRDLRVRWALEEAGLRYELGLWGPRIKRPKPIARCSHSASARL